MRSNLRLLSPVLALVVGAMSASPGCAPRETIGDRVAERARADSPAAGGVAPRAVAPAAPEAGPRAGTLPPATGRTRAGGAVQAVPPREPAPAWFHQLVLLAESGTEAETAVLQQDPTVVPVHLAHVDPVRAGWLVERICPAVGPGGSSERFVLVYQSPKIQQLAARVAQGVDRLAAQSADPASAALREWLQAGVVPGGCPEAQHTRRALEMWPASGTSAGGAPVGSGGEAPAGDADAWLAAMIRGWMLACAAEYERASEAFRVAERLAGTDSLRAMLAAYAQLRICRDRCEPIDVARLAQRVALTYYEHRASFAYQEALEIAKKPVRPRRRWLGAAR